MYERKLADIISLLFATLAFVVPLLGIALDSKEVQGFWNKSIIEWLVVTLMLIMSGLLAIATTRCFKNVNISYIIPISIGIGLIVNIFYVLLAGEHNYVIDFFETCKALFRWYVVCGVFIAC